MLQNAKITWNEAGTPVSDAFGDVYFSNDNGLNETRYVFLQQNGLPERWINHPHPTFIIAETGFGTGLNFLATWQQFNIYREQQPSGNVSRLHFISFEKYPLSRSDLILALNSWPELNHLSTKLIDIYPHAVSGCHRLQFDHGQVVLDLWFGDVNEQLPQIYCPPEGYIDAWYLDGFAPSKNPDMWSSSLFQQMFRLCRENATLATFTAAGFVRRGLAEAGFAMNKAPGYGKKREMLQGKCSKSLAPDFSSCSKSSEIAVVGGGIAAASLVYLLTQRGYQVSLYCAESDVAQSASGNPQGAVYPLLHTPEDTLSQFFAAAFDFCKQTIQPVLESQKIPHDWNGVEIRNIDEKQTRKNQQVLAAGFPDELITSCDKGVFFPTGGWLNPALLTQTLFSLASETGQLSKHFNTQITAFNKTDTDWQLVDQTNHLWHADQVILANGAHIDQFTQTAGLPITPVRGQISFIQAFNHTNESDHVICGDGYVVPQHAEQQVIGATYTRNDFSRDVRESDHQENIQKMQSTLQSPSTPVTVIGGRAAIRAVTRDHLPLVGGMRTLPEDSDLSEEISSFSAAGWLPDNKTSLYVLAGLGSRGLCSAPLAAEILISLILKEPLPCSLPVLNDLDPQRRWLKPFYRKWRRAQRA